MGPCRPSVERIWHSVNATEHPTLSVVSSHLQNCYQLYNEALSQPTDYWFKNPALSGLLMLYVICDVECGTR